MSNVLESAQNATHRIRLMLTREGAIYLVVLVFIAAGALLRNINLLILMTGIMVAPVLIGWRISLAMMKRIRLKRTLPKICFAQQPFEVNWEVKNNLPSLSSWQLVLRDQCTRVIATPTAQRPEMVRLLFPVIRPGESVFQTYKACVDSRGEYEFGPVVLRSRFPFGLLQAIVELPAKETIFVAPALGNLTTSWDRRLLSKASGSSAVKRKRGLVDDEFFALRSWRSGDSLKQIHWRTTAKYAHPMVKQFDTRTDKDFVLILDLFTPETVATGGMHHERIERMLSFGSTLFSRIQGHVFGQMSIAVCGSETTTLSDNVYSRIAFDVFKSLAVAAGSSNPQTLKAMLEVGKRASEGTPIYVFSSRPFSEPLLDALTQAERVRYRSLEQWIRWVEVSSLEFHEIFQPIDTPANADFKRSGDLAAGDSNEPAARQRGAK
jgi:Protein of unknown function DUF58